MSEKTRKERTSKFTFLELNTPTISDAEAGAHLDY